MTHLGSVQGLHFSDEDRLILSHPKPLDFFSVNSRSFSFASRFFPKETRLWVADLYAFCRLTDNLVDEAPKSFDKEQLETQLCQWQSTIESAYHHGNTPFDLLNRLFQRTKQSGVAPDYAFELIEGCRMDLVQNDYQDTEALYLYTYRVASVIGLWMTEMCGIHDPQVLKKAESLGHAMQLTNILRDVGEDLERDRLYLPLSLMKKHQLTKEDLKAIHSKEKPLCEKYKAIIKDLGSLAEKHYQIAYEGMPYLPGYFQKPIAIAASVYSGILKSLEKNNYNNFHYRAKTGLSEKLILASKGLKRLKRAKKEI